MRVQAQAAFYSGPLPHPEALERYNSILPGCAERIVKMAESQHAHRLDLERRAVKSNVLVQKMGPVLGFSVSTFSVYLGYLLVMAGKSGQGLAAIITPVAALAGVFFYGKKEQKTDLANKQQGFNQ